MRALNVLVQIKPDFEVPVVLQINTKPLIGITTSHYTNPRPRNHETILVKFSIVYKMNIFAIIYYVFTAE